MIDYDSINKYCSTFKYKKLSLIISLKFLYDILYYIYLYKGKKERKHFEQL